MSVREDGCDKELKPFSSLCKLKWCLKCGGKQMIMIIIFYEMFQSFVVDSVLVFVFNLFLLHNLNLVVNDLFMRVGLNLSFSLHLFGLNIFVSLLFFFLI